MACPELPRARGVSTDVDSASTWFHSDPTRVLLGAWLLLNVAAAIWLPGYNGFVVGAGGIFIPIYAVIAGLAAVFVRGHARSVRNALLSTLPTLALLAAAGIVGDQRNEEMAQFRGEPLFLYFGVTLWVSWAALVLSTALVARSRWSSFAGIGLGVLVAVLGLFMFTMRID